MTGRSRVLSRSGEMSRAPSLATRRGKILLALLCAVAFLDFIDASIVSFPARVTL